MSSNNNTDGSVSMITLQQADIRKAISIDFTKKSFTDNEKTMIKKEVSVIKEKYPTYIPIIVRTKETEMLTKRKFLVSGDITVGQFMTILRKKMERLKQSEAVFLFINDTVIPPASTFLQTLYANHKDPETDMLFITACKENTFG